MSIADARDDLQRAVHAYAADRSPGNWRAVESSARDFAKAQQDAATGVTAAVFQAAQDKKRGVQLCPSCSERIIPARGADGGPSRFLDARSLQPHFCRRR